MGVQIPERVQWAVELLAVRPTDHVLEIGCGPGHAVSLLCEKLTRGSITAIDRSAVQVTRARERNRKCIAAGRAYIERAALNDFEPGRQRFDKIFAVNVNAFWTDPAPTVDRVRRLLRPAGAVYLVYEPPSAARLREVRGSIPTLLREHSFKVEEVRTRDFRASHGLGIVARLS